MPVRLSYRLSVLLNFRTSIRLYIDLSIRLSVYMYDCPYNKIFGKSMYICIYIPLGAWLMV